MTDRELLELAAKAAGMAGWKYGGEVFGMLEVIDPLRMHESGSKGSCWNPLHNDGDALRLAVKLGMMVDSDIKDADSTVIAAGIWEREKHGAEPYAAIRRAIVRAAAEIGKSMP